MSCEVAALPFQAHAIWDLANRLCQRFDYRRKKILEELQLLVKDHDINCNWLTYEFLDNLIRRILMLGKDYSVSRI